MGLILIRPMQPKLLTFPSLFNKAICIYGLTQTCMVAHLGVRNSELKTRRKGQVDTMLSWVYITGSNYES